MTAYRERVFRDFTMRWVCVPCFDAGKPVRVCVLDEHKVALIGFRYPRDEELWMPLVELTDQDEAVGEAMALRTGTEMGVEGWRLLVAAYGLPWPMVTPRRIEVLGNRVWAAPQRVLDVLPLLGEEALLRGRSFLGSSPVMTECALVAIAEYRENVGGVHR